MYKTVHKVLIPAQNIQKNEEKISLFAFEKVLITDNFDKFGLENLPKVTPQHPKPM